MPQTHTVKLDRSDKNQAWNPKSDRNTELISNVEQSFFSQTTIHGLKYLLEPKKTRFERGFWILAVICSWAFAAFMIIQVIITYHFFFNSPQHIVLAKWQESPILVSYDSTTTPIWELPFPALTICNMNKVQRSRIEAIEAILKRNASNDFYAKERRFATEICQKTTARHSELQRAPSNQDVSVANLDIDGKMLQHYMNNLGQDCSQMLLRCEFKGISRNCSELFIPVITDEGRCCSFNIMPESIMFKDVSVEQLQVEDHEETVKLWSHWDMETGYRFGPNEYDGEINITSDAEPMPRRAVAPGLHMGLSVLLDVREQEYYCSGTESIGFKALLHTPATLPEMIEYGFAFEPGSETFLAVTPEMIHAEEQIHGISYIKRQCYLKGERRLKYLNHYTFLNCFMECASNFTFKTCDCVAYYMPRNSKTMPICAPERHACVDRAIKIVQESAFDDKHAENTECNCLPPCSDFSYPHETSKSKLKAALLNLSQDLIKAHPEFLNESYVNHNLALVHLHFQNLHFIRHLRSELFGLTDFFATIGGLLGLSMGFSVLSLVEIVYFLVLKLLCKAIKPN
ncbi:pickpocket protein 28-like [Tigriopus californicus]|uniref:pickpocket protein 28-like n=1 Tax=Tigriopus californicus TaxID=6832 RepID=UPI0027D9EB54|nr:pickpocket protein 28-like [Tigriopus californicus]